MFAMDLAYIPAGNLTNLKDDRIFKIVELIQLYFPSSTRSIKGKFTELL